MQQIAEWLEKLGLPEYAQRFAANDIDWSVLRYLTDQDLKELGVSLGHRRKMLASVADLVAATRGPVPPTEHKGEETAERRQVTRPSAPFVPLSPSEWKLAVLSARMKYACKRELASQQV